jgi:uncharacterized protein YyaL (SSP411 family)
MANRLGSATSPYLQQHAGNPVDWWEWSSAAFDEARRRDVPVLISVGYAACHWCHVMAHESFEDEDVAAVVNRLTVPIKVDREERPDVDAVYMTATQAMTGQGGWPMTVFATPDGQPFFCGTYFPRDNFLRLLRAIGDAWRDQRDAVLRQSATVVEAIGQVTERVSTELTSGVLDAAAASLFGEYDELNGGFGGAPKFPPHMNLLFLLRRYQRTGDERALSIVRGTCERMARGGMYDQLAGGFARYSVDRTWTVPHFEKMLYDNALLLRVYTELFRVTGDRLARRIADETAEFLVRDLQVDGGGFASALDADTGGVEGATYVWTPDQLRAVLGDEDGPWAADLLAVTGTGTFEHGTSVLQLPRDPDDWARWQRVRETLATERNRRPQPARDDKVVTAWNGLAVTGLIEYARLVDRPDIGEAALGAAAVLADLHLVGGRLRRASRDRKVGEPAGVLEDYGAAAEAFGAAHQYTGEGRWLELAGRLLDVGLERFADGNGGFYDTADDAEALVTRPADPTDNATPSGLSAMAAALTGYSALTGDTRYREAAEAALSTVSAVAARYARFTGYSCATGEALLAGPLEIAIATEAPGDELALTAIRHAPGGSVIVVGRPDASGVPLLKDRPMRGGGPTAYVCRGFVCETPVTDPADLVAALRTSPT